MIFAEIQGKLAEDYSLAHERAEDLLTSTVFQLLRYMPFEFGFGELLSRIRPVGSGRIHVPDPTWISTTGVDSVEVALWSSLGAAGIPDVMLTLFNKSRPVHIVLIEAKLYSGKSGLDESEIESDFDHQAEPQISNVEFSRDQLAKYWQGLNRSQKCAEDVPRSLVYLTAHATAPLEELLESLALDQTMRLGWLSWFDVWSVATYACKREEKCLPALDLVQLLAHRGFFTFCGFRSRPPPVSSSNRFWNARKWFTVSTPDLHVFNSDWRFKEGGGRNGRR